MSKRLFVAAELGLSYMKELKAMEDDLVGKSPGLDGLVRDITVVQWTLLKERNEVPGLDVDFRRETAAVAMHALIPVAISASRDANEPWSSKEIACTAAKLADNLIEALG